MIEFIESCWILWLVIIIIGVIGLGIGLIIEFKDQVSDAYSFPFKKYTRWINPISIGLIILGVVSLFVSIVIK